MIRRGLAAVSVVLALVAMDATPAVADRVRAGQWYLADLHLAEAHRTTRGAGVTVALIDTGVDARHRDLAGAVLSGTTTLNNAWADPTGRDDHDGHGTNMAGIIAARGHGNGDGVLGIAPAAKILPISSPTDQPGSTSFMSKAVDFAIAEHALVINMSFIGPGDDTMLDAIRKAQANDIVVVAGSGNQNDQGAYPGKYPEVLTVGAYGQNHKITSYSVTGPQVDLTAPGDRIVTTGIGPTGYDTTNGTSEATAVVSGAVSLLRAKYPTMSAAEVVHRLTATADDAGPSGRDDTYGYGRLNLVKALTADVAPRAATSASTAGDAAAPNLTPALGTGDLPEAASPLLLAGILAGLVLLIGAVVAAVVVRRRRPRA